LKLRVLWFGRPAASPYEDQVASYRKRVSQRWPAEDRAVRPVAGGRDADPARALAAEAELVARQLPEGWRVVAMDEGGRATSSEDFAHWLAELESGGVRGVVFVIGSDLGLDEALKARAHKRMSLSTMTLAHQLARVVLWEQLFRATHILGGGGYHRHRVQ
jgi:23S rRNA (pseudouridine1915-N3)-methyltransferase